MSKLFLMSFLFLTALSADRVEVMFNGVGTAESCNAFLKKHHVDATVYETDTDQYGKGFKKSHTMLGKILRKFSLDYPKSIELKPDLRKIIFMNIPHYFYRDNHVAKLPKEKTVLFMWEPEIRLRKMYYPKLHDCFSKIYTWNDDLVDNKKYFKFFYPVLQSMISDVVPFEEKKFCTLVSGHVPNLPKYPRKYPQELYSHRVKAIEFFEKVGEEGFEFYGRHWDKNAYKSYRGPVSDKISVIKNYKFSICYENCRDVPGYISEKIFDCFAAGNVPVYWGPANVTEFIPADCFIDRRKFASLDELYVYLKSMTKQEYQGYLDRIQTYLKSEKAQLFSKEHYEKIFLEAIATIQNP
ncbi:MAG TPA: glycosyltransferase family 10 [Rhabdochlamydiaceae bacterium]|nr:glycosyltransferase family 10 [Rhabdochlamydiaceae bacterium]